MVNVEMLLSFDDVPAEIEIAERGAKEKDFWPSIKLVDVDEHDMNMTWSLEEDSVRIYVGAHHVENPETSRAFHATLRANLTYARIKQLRDFLTLMLTFQEED